MAKLHFLKSVTDTINTSFILESGDTLLVVDGGYVTETPYVYEYLKQLGGHVDTWFITHFHDDHFGCLFTLLNEHPDIKVDKLCYTFPSEEFLVGHEVKQTALSTKTWFDIIRESVAHYGIPVIEAKTGDVYEFDGGRAVVRVVRTYDEHPVSNNGTSIVFRFEAAGKSILFLGDLDGPGSKHLLATADPALLRSDYVQMAHHGQNGVNQDVYEAIHPTYCLWPTPTWLWNNRGPGGYDTGIYETVVTRGWISAMHCVKKHYLMQEGTHVIDLNDN